MATQFTHMYGILRILTFEGTDIDYKRFSEVFLLASFKVKQDREMQFRLIYGRASSDEFNTIQHLC